MEHSQPGTRRIQETNLQEPNVNATLKDQINAFVHCWHPPQLLTYDAVLRTESRYEASLCLLRFYKLLPYLTPG